VRWHRDQVRAVVARIIVHGLSRVALHHRAVDLKALNLSVRYDCAASVSACQIAPVSITGTAPPYQSSIRLEGISSICSNATSALYFFAMV
jgi:hypothetical protein